MNSLCLYHASCHDGFGAAVSMYQSLPDARYIPVSRDDTIPDEVQSAVKDADRVFILDFSYSRDVLLNWHDSGKEIVVLDHHKTAEEDLRGLSFAKFDMNKSGAVLAWEYFNPGVPVPILLQYVQDRDLWRFNLLFSREISEALFSYDMTFEKWNEWIHDEQFIEFPGSFIEEMSGAGEAILRSKRKNMEPMLRNVEFFEIQGHKVPVVNSMAFMSDVGELLNLKYPDAPFSAVYFHNSRGTKWSLRTQKDFDVSVIASKYGGGGHRRAAGFVLPKGVMP